ncbi:YdcF family protein [Clostridium sp. SHJSY1]|uniref:SanA/YdcF family protein n=1 Tax=Clostridium sp. SHJSY1 TaxID=2942483 RepID=UPI0028765B84|nr:ElyC/SanA/YdcF family protein [Clostridium sp. SHJSY1]MDS0524411.1 YdcF family protein [Clostridium sp. SHJSY1]
MKKNKVLRVVLKIVIAMLVLLSIGVIVGLVLISTVQKNGESKIVSVEDIPKDVDAIIVLGAGVKSDGSPCDMLVDRLKTSIEVYKKDNNSKFLLSGDHGKQNYNEVGTMKKFIQENCNVDESKIFLDHAGFSTYESMYRAKEIFKVKKAIIITNEYHLPRALYIANKLGIEAYGVKSDIRNYVGIDIYKGREKLAQLKDFFTAFIKPKSTYLGEEIPVNTSDGRVTDDKISKIN